MRDLENRHFEQVGQQAASLVEKAVATADAEDGGGFSDEARGVLSEKEGLSNSMQASHDSHLTAIDGAEDRLLGEEKARYNSLLGDARTWESTRNRDRISEARVCAGCGICVETRPGVPARPGSPPR